MQRLTLATLLLLSLFSGLSVASPALLSAPSSGSVLNGQIELLEDVGGQLSIADMADPAVQSRFQPAAGRTSVGQSSNPWWIIAWHRQHTHSRFVSSVLPPCERNTMWWTWIWTVFRQFAQRWSSRALMR